MAAITVFVPRDAAALSLGAEDVAQAIAAEAAARKIDVEIVRNGTRGMVWLEPLVEVALSSGRSGYGPVSAADVRSLFDADFLKGGAHALSVGPVEQIPYFAKQERLTFARVGVTDPVSLDAYLAHGGYQGFMRAVSLSPVDIIKEVTESGLRGRGGAAFPTGIKWKTVADAPPDHGNAQKYVTCNADEGDSGTFADRMLMEGDPFCLIEGMTIAAIAVGATQGYIYLRVEYPHAHRALNAAIEAAYAEGYLGANIRGTGKHFDLEVRLGAGAYICGEETSMLESLEGKRGEIRPRPPLPAIKGLFGQPTIVNNVMSLASVPIILAEGRGVLPRFRRRQVARHAHDPARRQHQARRADRTGLRRDAARGPLRLRRRQRVGAAHPCGPGGRPAWRVPPGVTVRYAPRLRGVRERAGAARPWRHRRVRRYGGHGPDGAVCDGVLRHRIVRKMHAVSHRFHPGRGGHGPGHCRPEP